VPLVQNWKIQAFENSKKKHGLTCYFQLPRNEGRKCGAVKVLENVIEIGS